MQRKVFVGAIGAVLVVAAAVGCSTSNGNVPQRSEPSCGGEAGRAPRYSTSFPVDEFPISEGGAWSHTGKSWTYIRTANGNAHGTQTGQGGYDDSYAYLSGFPPDQQACAVIHKGSPVSYQEVEILLRWSDSENSAQGYECFIHHSGQYAKIVRWNGPYGDFTTIADVGNVAAPQNGDMIRATAAGNVITLYLNDQMLAQAVDSTYPTGSPGMGFFKDQDGGANTELGYENYTATAL